MMISPLILPHTSLWYRHPREGGGPVNREFWVPAFAGMTMRGAADA